MCWTCYRIFRYSYPRSKISWSKIIFIGSWIFKTLLLWSFNFLKKLLNDIHIQFIVPLTVTIIPRTRSWVSIANSFSWIDIIILNGNSIFWKWNISLIFPRKLDLKMFVILPYLGITGKYHWSVYHQYGQEVSSWQAIVSHWWLWNSFPLKRHLLVSLLFLRLDPIYL